MRILLALIFLSNIANAQLFPGHDSAFVKGIDELPSKEPFDTAHKYKKVNNAFIYIISTEDVYTHFGYATYLQYRDFNFTDYHIFGEQQCKDCLHSWVWTMRENKKAFTPVTVTSLPGHTGFDEPNRQYLPQDTIIKYATDTAQVKWYTTSMGDCHAHFEYALFTDKYYPVLLLKESSYYGGCRAGGFFDVTLSFKMPSGITQHVKNTLFIRSTKSKQIGFLLLCQPSASMAAARQ